MLSLSSKETDVSPGLPTTETLRRRVLHRAEQSLDGQSSQLGRMVKCDFDDGTLILRGQVPTFYHKQLAQTTLKDLESVQGIDNRIVVDSHCGSNKK